MPMLRTGAMLILTATCSPASSAIVEISESFDGNGEFASLEDNVQGLDNPGWRVLGDAELRDGGLVVVNESFSEVGYGDRITQTITGRGSFRSRLELRELALGDFNGTNDPIASNSQVFFIHKLARRFNRLSFHLTEHLDHPDLDDDSQWSLSMWSGESGYHEVVPRGEHVALEILFDERASQATFLYDNDTLSDEAPPLVFGPFAYDGVVNEQHGVELFFSAIGSNRISNGIVDHYSLTPLSNIAGDFSGNEVLDVSDINLLSVAIRANGNEARFDLDEDTLVSSADLDTWVRDLRQTYFGDANLDGIFASSDLVNVFTAGEYEDDVALNSTWATGDWNADGEFTSSDIVKAFEDGGYEVGPRIAVVPEPSALLPTVLGIVLLLQWLQWA